VNRNSCDLVAERLALAGVQTCSDDDSEARSGVADGQRAANGPCRTIERREEAVTRRVDLAAAKARDLAAP
jgi:hypothetical protein